MKKLWEDFKKFVKRGNVVDMAVGVAIASAFTAIVTAFTKGFISPLLALLAGESTLSEVKWVLRPEVLAEDGVTVVTAEVAILWGAFLQAIFDFMIIAVALFTVMKVATAVRERAERLSKEVKNHFSNEDELLALAAEKEKAEAEAAQRIAEEERLLKEAAIAEAEEKERARLEREEALLKEMRDILKEIRDNK